MHSLNSEIAVTSANQEEFSIVDEQKAVWIDAVAADVVDAECNFDNQLSAGTLVDNESYEDLSESADLQKLASTCKYYYIKRIQPDHLN